MVIDAMSLVAARSGAARRSQTDILARLSQMESPRGFIRLPAPVEEISFTQRGIDSAIAGLIGGADLYDSLAGLTVLVAPDVAATMREQAGSVRAFLEKGLSPRAAEALRKQFFTLGKDAAYRDPYAIWLQVMRQLPTVAAIVGSGGAAGAAGKAAGAATGTINALRAGGAALSGAAIGGGQAATEAAADITPETPSVQERVGQGEDPETALREEQRKAGAIASSIAMPLSAAVAVPQARLAAGVFSRAAAGTKGRLVDRAVQAAVTGAVGGVLEGVQEAGEQVGVETARAVAGLPFRPEALAEAGIAGAVIGTGTTATMNIAGRTYGTTKRLLRREPPPTNPPGLADIGDQPAAPEAAANIQAPPEGPAARTVPIVRAPEPPVQPDLFEQGKPVQLEMDVTPPATRVPVTTDAVSPVEETPARPKGSPIQLDLFRPAPADKLASLPKGSQLELDLRPESHQLDLFRSVVRSPDLVATLSPETQQTLDIGELARQGDLFRNAIPENVDDVLIRSGASALARIALPPSLRRKPKAPSKAKTKRGRLAETAEMQAVRASLEKAGVDVSPPAVAPVSPEEGATAEAGGPEAVPVEPARKPLSRSEALRSILEIEARREASRARPGAVPASSPAAPVPAPEAPPAEAAPEAELEPAPPGAPPTGAPAKSRRSGRKGGQDKAAAAVVGAEQGPPAPTTPVAAPTPEASPPAETQRPKTPPPRTIDQEIVARRERTRRTARKIVAPEQASATPLPNQPVLPEAGAKEVAPEPSAEPDTRTFMARDGSVTDTMWSGPPPASDPYADVNTALGRAFELMASRGEAVPVQRLSGLILGRLPADDQIGKITKALMSKVGMSTRVVVVREAGPAAAVYVPSSDTIRIHEPLVPPWARLPVLLHELAHAVTHGLIQTDAGLANRVDTLSKNLVEGLSATGNDTHARIAEALRTSSRAEVLATLMTSPSLQQMARMVDGAGPWTRFRRSLRVALGMVDADTLDKVMTASVWDAPADPQRRALLAGALTMGEQAEQSWSALAGIMQIVTGPNQSANAVSALTSPRVMSLLSRGKVFTRRRLIDGLTMENILDWFGPKLGAATNGEAELALRSYHDASAAMAHRANDLVAAPLEQVAEFDELMWKDPKEATELASLMHDATIRKLHPDRPLTDRGNRVGSLQPGAATVHAELAARWDALSPQAKNLFEKLRKSAFNTGRAYVEALAASIIRDPLAKELGLDPLSPEAIGAAKIRAAQIVQEVIEGAPVLSLPAELSMSRAMVKALQSLKAFVDSEHGPYFPLLRTGKYFVIAGSPEYTRKTFTQQEWDNLTDPALQVDLDSIASFPSTGNSPAVVSADVRRYAVYTVDSEYEARALAERLKAQLFSDMPSTVGYRSRDEFASLLRRQMPSTELEIIIDAATKGLDPEVAKDVTDNILELMAARSQAGSRVASRIRRENVLGASRNIPQATMRQAATMGRQTARLEYDAIRRAAIRRMQEIEKRLATTDPATGALLSDVRQSLIARDELTDMLLSPYLGSRALARVANFTATAFLTVPAAVITNLTQTWAVSAPFLAGKHGAASAGSALARAGSDTVRGALHAARVAYSRILQGKSKIPPGETYHGYMTNHLPEDERAMIAELVKRNRLEFTVADDILEMTDPQRGAFASETATKAGQAWRRVQDFLFVAPRLGEVFNRVSTALAAYRLARDSGTGDFAAHVKAADDAVRLTHFNYEAYNKSRFFITPYLRPMLVFKQYAYGMYFLQGYMLKQLLDTSNPTARAEAARTLGLFYAIHLAVAGVAGGVPEPIWMAINAIAKLLGMTGDEMIRRGVAELLGDDWAPTVTRGPVAEMLGVDLRRMALSEMFFPSDLFRAQSGNELLEAILTTYFGAPGGAVTSTVDGMALLADGQLLKGAARAIPIKIVGSPLQAVDWMVNGITDRRGNPILTPEEIETWAIGLRALGYSPFAVSERGEMSARKMAIERRIAAEKQRVYRDFMDALVARKGMGDAIKKLGEFNRRWPESAIDMKDVRASLRERRRARRQIRGAGVPLPNAQSRKIAQDLLRIYAVPEVLRERSSGLVAS